jgi:glycosyltransferase involved in cell wall biosynthesis
MEHITVCICTYKRPQLLKRLLEELGRQETRGLFHYSIVVVDNDNNASAKQVAENFAANSTVPTAYYVEPQQNIALARNRAVANAQGDYVAFIDDDEFPDKDWLLVMMKTIKSHEAAGVLAPVLPHFETEPPKWLRKAGFYDRPRHQTGFILEWQGARTGNVLIRRRILDEIAGPFQPEFGAGGEDQDFFRRLMDKGHVFIWCDESPVCETVPPHRWDRRFLLERALLRGKLTFRHPKNRLRKIVKSLIAVPLYAIALPFLLILGHHLFMKYLVRLFDHLGRLLALMNLNPIKERCH